MASPTTAASWATRPPQAAHSNPGDRTPETRIEARLVWGVRSLGGRVEKLLPSRSGLPDRLVLLPGGRVCFIELKAADGRLAPLQRHWREKARQLGTDVAVLSSYAEVDRWLHRQATALGKSRQETGLDSRSEAAISSHDLKKVPGGLRCSCGWQVDAGRIWTQMVPAWAAHIAEVSR